MTRTAERGPGHRGPARRRVRGWLGTAFAVALLAGIVGSWVRLGTTTPLVTVATGSMVPTLHIGDIALMESLHGRSPRVGEIVVAPVPIDVQQQLHYPPSVTHRVVEIKGGMLTTKGDANPVKDPFAVPVSSVHIRLVRVIPGAGRFVKFLVSPFGLIWVLIGAILLAGPKLVEVARGPAPPAAVATADGAVLGELLVAVREYGEHLQSHTAILKAMSEASQDLSAVVARLEEQRIVPTELERPPRHARRGAASERRPAHLRRGDVLEQTRPERPAAQTRPSTAADPTRTERQAAPPRDVVDVATATVTATATDAHRRPLADPSLHTPPRRRDAVAALPRPAVTHADVGLGALARYVAAHGHARVPEGHVEGTFPLGDWLAAQRRAARTGQLPADRVAQLELLGVARVRRSRRSA